MIELVLTILWGLGWFATLAIAAAGFFANWERFNEGTPEGEEVMWFFLAVPYAALMFLLWPFALAIMVGWFFMPFAVALFAEREALER
jgi:hypothetical protein